jgi:hypothetical protein
MGAKNNGTLGTRGFIQVQAFVRIKTLRPVCVDLLQFVGLRPPLPLFLQAKVVGFTRKIRVNCNST